jgi:hypothetical protein
MTDRYPSGRYIVRYEGTTPSYRFDAKTIERSPGRDVLEVTPSAAGFSLYTNGPIKNLSVIPEQYEPPHRAGGTFHPLFLEKLRGIKPSVLRFVSWMATNNGSTQGIWADRPKPSDTFWGSRKGVPLEVMIDLCNTLGVGPWFNMPHLCDNEYAWEFAAFVKPRLNPALQQPANAPGWCNEPMLK